MKTNIKILLFLLVSFFIYKPASVIAQGAEIFYKANVEEIVDQGEATEYGLTAPYQIVTIKILDKELQGKTYTIDHGKGYIIDTSQLVYPGQTVVVVATLNDQNQPLFRIADTYRLDKVIPIILAFFTIIIILGGWKGLGSIFGMIISLLVIVTFIVPQILNGNNPLFVSIIGCLIIMISTIYLAHGFSKQTTIALISTFLTLIATGILAVLFVQLAHLTGLGSEDAYSLKLGAAGNINFQGLLLGGILIGALGVLDDITTGLSASIFEIARANPSYSFGTLYASGLRIGREHIASLVNTLVLAYAGVSLPLFITIVINPNHYPLYIILNDPLIVEEIIRTLAGSMGLIFAVPLTTILASYYASRSQQHDTPHKKNTYPNSK